MTVRDELALAVSCAKRGAAVGAISGVLTGNFIQAVGISAALTAGIYLSAKSTQFAAEAEAPAARL